MPASWSRRCTSGSSPARSPITMAATIAADCALQRPTAAAIARREKARAALNASSATGPRAMTSTSAALLTVPTSVVPRRASARS
ncbi:MAG: hypothetical protein JF610_14480 [Acidobacteria bacterium]|nr:hypothetical protein [Acidobacteriota bacterium]